MIGGLGRAGRAMAVAAAVGSAAPAAAGGGHDYIPPRGREAIGYGLSGLGYGHGAWYVWPYRTKSALYGYPDYAYGRGPLINLGGDALQAGFRGYGMFGNPGYGLGMYPSTWTDQRPAWGRRGAHRDGGRRGRVRPPGGRLGQV